MSGNNEFTEQDIIINNNTTVIPGEHLDKLLNSYFQMKNDINTISTANFIQEDLDILISTIRLELRIQHMETMTIYDKEVLSYKKHQATKNVNIVNIANMEKKL